MAKKNGNPYKQALNYIGELESDGLSDGVDYASIASVFIDDDIEEDISEGSEFSDEEFSSIVNDIKGKPLNDVAAYINEYTEDITKQKAIADKFNKAGFFDYKMDLTESDTGSLSGGFKKPVERYQRIDTPQGVKFLRTYVDKTMDSLTKEEFVRDKAKHMKATEGGGKYYVAPISSDSPQNRALEQTYLDKKYKESEKAVNVINTSL